MAIHDRYNKLFASIVTSSIWVADPVVFKVWIAMIALKDSWGQVSGTIPGFANLCNISIPEMERAERALMDPDPYSRTADNEGRRIERCDGGWQILNSDKYDEAIDLQKRREQTRLRAKRYRERNAGRNASDANVTHRHATVTPCNAPQPQPQPHKETTTTDEALDSPSAPPAPWYENVEILEHQDQLVRILAKAIRKVPKYEHATKPPTAKSLAEAARRLREAAPDREGVEFAIREWVRFHSEDTTAKAGRKDPVGSLRNWIETLRVGRWKNVKRQAAEPKTRTSKPPTVDPSKVDWGGGQ